MNFHASIFNFSDIRFVIVTSGREAKSMIVINCTQKLLRRSRIPRTTDQALSTNTLGAWCANIFNIGRTPFVLLTNEMTFLSIVFPYREFKNLSHVMSTSLYRQLLELGIPMNRIAAEVEHCTEISFASDTKRSVLGTMNDMVFQIKAIVEMDGDVNIVELARLMRETPFSAIRSTFPEKAVREVLGNNYSIQK